MIHIGYALHSTPFKYTGLRVSIGSHRAFDLHGDPVEDYETVCSVAEHLGTRSVTFSSDFDIFRSKLPEEAETALNEFRTRKLTEVEKTYYSALRHVILLRPEERYCVGDGCITRHGLLPGEDMFDTPRFSAKTRSSSGGNYSARAALYAVGVTPPLYVGDGVTINLHSDRSPATVVAVSPSGKTVTVQKDDWKVVSGSTHDGSAVYEYSLNPEGRKVKARVRKDGRYYPTRSSKSLSFGRNRYYDPHF